MLYRGFSARFREIIGHQTRHAHINHHGYVVYIPTTRTSSREPRSFQLCSTPPLARRFTRTRPGSGDESVNSTLPLHLCLPNTRHPPPCARNPIYRNIEYIQHGFGLAQQLDRVIQSKTAFRSFWHHFRAHRGHYSSTRVPNRSDFARPRPRQGLTEKLQTNSHSRI